MPFRARPSFFDSSAAPQKIRKFSNIRCDPSRLILAEQLGCGSPTRLILEIDMGELLPGAVRHDECPTLNVSANVLDRPRRREAAGCLTSSKPKYRDHHQNKNVKRKNART
jgi:hypothetical protein